MHNQSRYPPQYGHNSKYKPPYAKERIDHRLMWIDSDGIRAIIIITTHQKSTNVAKDLSHRTRVIVKYDLIYPRLSMKCIELESCVDYFSHASGYIASS